MNEHSTENAPVEPNDNHTGDDRTDGTEGTAKPLRRRNFLKGLTVAGGVVGTGPELLAGGTAARTTTAESGWQMKEPQLETPWTADVGPDNAHQEYPRPQLVRERWKNLNGIWQFSTASEGESPPIGQDLDERVLVPYPIESALSGIKRHENWMWYRRQFTVPDEWIIPTADPEDDANNPNAQRLRVHFERVDWEATVYVNGQRVTQHQGGYDHFVVDVTDALIEDGSQELIVGVYDPTGNNTEPVGTQPKGRQGIGTGFEGQSGLWMTPTSGIWDTVWLEPVPDPSVTNLDMTPDLGNDVLRLTVDATTENATVVATAYDDTDEEVGRVVGPANQELGFVSL